MAKYDDGQGQKSFNLAIKEISEELGIDIVDVVAKTALDLFKKINEKSPVLTGYSRANWNVGLDFIKNSVSKNVERPAVNIAARVLDKLVLGQVVNISNNVVYIKRLEEGSSSQARAGMVVISLEEIQNDRKHLSGKVYK